jgi:hypothetical protein
MKQVQKVWAELSALKKNLSSRKVNLNLTDDLEDQISITRMAIGEAVAVEERLYLFEEQLDTLIKSAKEIVGAAEDVKDLIGDHQRDGYQIMDEFDRLANELGIQGVENESYRNLATLLEDKAQFYIDKMDMHIQDIKEYNLI